MEFIMSLILQNQVERWAHKEKERASVEAPSFLALLPLRALRLRSTSSSVVAQELTLTRIEAPLAHPRSASLRLDVPGSRARDVLILGVALLSFQYPPHSKK